MSFQSLLYLLPLQEHPVRTNVWPDGPIQEQPIPADTSSAEWNTKREASYVGVTGTKLSMPLISDQSAHIDVHASSW